MDIPDLVNFCKDHKLDMTFRTTWFMEADEVQYLVRIERQERNGWIAERDGDNLSDIIEAVIASANRFLEKEVMDD